MKQCKAYKELQRVEKLPAFNVQGYVKRQKVNQHVTVYLFDDKSTLDINTTRQVGTAYGFHPAFKRGRLFWGLLALRVNTTGA